MANTVVPKFITTLFKGEIERIHKVLLKEISKDYGISLDELNTKYLATVDVNTDKIEIIRRRKYNSNMEDAQRCIALNSKHKQCKRSKGNHQCFCNAHMYKQRYGTLNNPVGDDNKEHNVRKLY
jgi:hypothetical protein